MRRITDQAELQAFRQKYAAGSAGDNPLQCHRCKTGDAIAYTWKDDQGRPRAIAWLGRAQNPYSGNSAAVGGPYFFKTEERRQAWVAELFRRATAAADRTEKARAEKAQRRAAGHALAVGDVLCCTWGYDQTNVEYFEVTKLVGAQMVEYRPIARQSESTAHMQGDCVPAPGHYTGEAKRARVSDYGNRDSIKIYSFASAHKVKPLDLPCGLKAFPASHWTAYA